jgi:hypothetical protein
MKKGGTMRTIAMGLILSVTLFSVYQPQAQAMLVPTSQSEIREDSQPTTPTLQRQSDLQTVQKTLESKILRARLHQLGLSDAEISNRINRLSDTQLHQMASQIRTVNPAGDGIIIGLLVVVLLVVLIIYLVKRI